MTPPGDGPAYPTRLTLRDEFAMHAPFSDRVWLAVRDAHPEEPMSTGLAEWAYRYADAMLKAREQK